MIILFANERLCGSDIDLDVNIHVSQTSLRSKSTPAEFLLSVANTVVMCPQNTPKIRTSTVGPSIMIRK